MLQKDTDWNKYVNFLQHWQSIWRVMLTWANKWGKLLTTTGIPVNEWKMKVISICLHGFALALHVILVIHGKSFNNSDIHNANYNDNYGYDLQLRHWQQ